MRAGRSVDTAHVASAIVSVWDEIDRALTPIVGARGMAALYGRTLFLTGRECVDCAGMPDGVTDAMRLDSLRERLLPCTPERATDIGCTLFLTLESLLSSMVGTALTERLLRAVWASHSSGETAQDTSS